MSQTLQTVINNGNTSTSPVKFFGHVDLGEAWDPTVYGAVQIARPVSQTSTHHLSFIRQGQMVYGLGFYNGSNVFSIQSGGDNNTVSGIFLNEIGNVGVGTPTPTEKLSVKGKIRAQEIKVEATNWPDYVFAKGYRLPSLRETEQHIKDNGHLPGIPSAEEVKANGVDLGEMNAKLLKKIEELTLHLIEKERKDEQLQVELKEQESIVSKLITRLDLLENKTK
jgi:hypothetical protein